MEQKHIHMTIEVGQADGKWFARLDSPKGVYYSPPCDSEEDAIAEADKCIEIVSNACHVKSIKRIL